MRRWGFLFSATLIFALSAIVFFGVACGGKWDFHIPISWSGDTLFLFAVVKAFLEEGSFPYQLIHSPRLGAPFHFDMGDFPLAENLHFIILKAISFFSSDVVFVTNVFYFLTFPVSALSMFYVARQYRISSVVGIFMGLLFAFLPFHLTRYSHFFLASYYLIPLMVLVILRVWSSRPLFFKWNESGYEWDCKSRRSLLSALIAFLTGAGGIYYAFYFCFFTALSGVSAALYRRSRYPLVSAGILISIVIGSAGLCLLPNQIYHLKNGQSLVAPHRSVSDSELYGLKLTHIVFPKHNHRIPALAKIRARYRSATPMVEGFDECVGVIAILGFLILIARLFWMKWKNTVFDKLSFLWTTGILFATVGGGSVFFAALVTSVIRSHNRISVFLAVFGLLAVGFGLRVLESRLSSKWVSALVVLLLCFGLYDQVTPDLAHYVENISKEYQDDRAFFQKIEASLPRGAMVLQLPYAPFPESGAIVNMTDYSHFRGYVHTEALRWSYGVPQMRPGDAEIQKVSKTSLNIDQIRSMGYQGVYIDRFGLKDRGQEIEKLLSDQLKGSPIVSENQRMSFFVISSAASPQGAKQ